MSSAVQSAPYKKWLCIICGFIYDEALGWPHDGIEPGTRWDDVPDDWLCPDCLVGKEDFEMIEMPAEPILSGAIPRPPPWCRRQPINRQGQLVFLVPAIQGITFLKPFASPPPTPKFFC